MIGRRFLIQMDTRCTAGAKSADLNPAERFIGWRLWLTNKQRLKAAAVKEQHDKGGGSRLVMSMNSTLQAVSARKGVSTITFTCFVCPMTSEPLKWWDCVPHIFLFHPLNESWKSELHYKFIVIKNQTCLCPNIYGHNVYLKWKNKREDRWKNDMFQSDVINTSCVSVYTINVKPLTTFSGDCCCDLGL